MKLPIAAIVVSHNEAHLLEDCLASITFCQEILVADMASVDETKAVASRYDARLLEVPLCNVVEQVYASLICQVEQNWVLLIDPDERFTPDLQKALTQLFATPISDSTALIQLPWHFFFKDQPLRGTVWGGQRFKTSILHKDRVWINDVVHRGLTRKPGFSSHQIEGTVHRYLAHHWAQSYGQLFVKHRRYLREEGRSLYEQGFRYSLVQQLRKGLFAFKHSFYTKRGYRDGLTGLLLSLFWMWYVFKRWSALKRYQQSI
ncbi:MAG: hypothetical protein AAF985_11800 [Bacteroidota bacterium]